MELQLGYQRIPSISGKNFQHPENYEIALAQHGQWCRWTITYTCSCVSMNTNQPDTKCPICRGRGKVYAQPSRLTIRQEKAVCDPYGRITPFNSPVLPGTIVVFLRNVPLALDPNQPLDGSFIQLAKPYPPRYSTLLIDYQFNPNINVNTELATVVLNNVIRANSVFSYVNGRDIPGSITKVTEVRDLTTKTDLLPFVSSFSKEFIYMSQMPGYSPGDKIEISYSYIKPWVFLIENVSPKKRFENAYTLENADATIVTPYYCQMSPNDLITSLSGELQGFEIIDPTIHDIDEIQTYFDVSKITRIIDENGNIYPPESVSIFERSKLIWNVPKPSVNYTVHFFYFPTYTLLKEYGTTRTAENKLFVNRYTLGLADHVNENSMVF